MSSRFRVFYHPACGRHQIPGHPERPERVMFMMQSLKQVLPASEFLEAPKVTDDQIMLFHTEDHIYRLTEKCDRAERSSKTQLIDSDTAVMPQTREAIYRAAGAVVAAVDAVFRSEDQLKAAFCCVRPPGHHAEPDKSMGFCFVNNAGVAAKYAQYQYGVGNVAVLDFDVHHGNGVESGFVPYGNLFYGSTHEKDNYPGTGAEPMLKGEEAARELDRRIVNRFLDAGPKSRGQFRKKWAEIISEMKRFRPELVIISAGFDAHVDDPLGGCELQEVDFAWATQEVLDACNELNEMSPVPCISVLEGGYNVKAIARSAVVHCQTLRQWSSTQIDPIKMNGVKAALPSATVHLEKTEAFSVFSFRKDPSMASDDSITRTNEIPSTGKPESTIDDVALIIEELKISEGGDVTSECW